VAAIVDDAAREQGVDPLLVHSIIQVESGYNQYAISHRGAEGLMQLFPPTAKSLGVSNSFDAEQNIRAGVKHLKQLQDRFKDDRLALAAYNAGEGAVTRFRGVPPYAETQNYVIKVGQTLGNARRKAKAAAPPAPETPNPEYAPVEHYVDAQGRLHLRTR
jgi:soluble lytic murein transglycosylase-like protein